MATDIYRLNQVSYGPALRWQRERKLLREKDLCNDALLLAEHYPVYTVGRATPVGDLPECEICEVIEVERGGSVTFHGPGQLVGYLIFDLKSRNRDVHQFLRDIETIILKTLKVFGITGARQNGLTGVWVKGEKIAALGLHVSKWITSHGFSLNIDMDLAPFRRVKPCGQDGRLVTSLQNLLGAHVPRQEVEKILIDQFQEIFSESVVFCSEIIPSIEE